MTTSCSRVNPTRRRMAGFSLVELMVAILIGMVGVLIMANVLLSSSERGRTTSGGNEAMSNGAVMLHMIQRDLTQAGYGINEVRLLGCSMTLPTGVTVPIAPVVVNPPTSLIPAGDAGSDRLFVIYGNSSFQPQGNSILSVSGSSYTVQSPASFTTNDYVLAVPDKAVADNCAGTVTLARVTGTTATTVTVNSASTTATALYNLGPVPRVIGYAVRNGALTSCDYMAVDCTSTTASDIALRWPALAPNIPVLRAVYGRDVPSSGVLDGTVNAWDQTTPVSPSSSTQLDPRACGWGAVLGMRLVLVARSATYESRISSSTNARECNSDTTTVSPTWQAASAAPINLAATSPSSSPNLWQCYRYRTFETVAPLRNMIWMGSTTGC